MKTQAYLTVAPQRRDLSLAAPLPLGSAARYAHALAGAALAACGAAFQLGL